MRNDEVRFVRPSFIIGVITSGIVLLSTSFRSRKRGDISTGGLEVDNDHWEADERRHISNVQSTATQPRNLLVVLSNYESLKFFFYIIIFTCTHT